MATLDVSAVSDIKFQVDTTVTMDTLTFKWLAGEVMSIAEGVTSITVDNTTAVAAMTRLGKTTQAFAPSSHIEAA